MVADNQGYLQTKNWDLHDMEYERLAKQLRKNLAKWSSKLWTLMKSEDRRSGKMEKYGRVVPDVKVVEKAPVVLWALWRDLEAANSELVEEVRDMNNHLIKSCFYFSTILSRKNCNYVSNCCWVQWISFSSGKHPTVSVFQALWDGILCPCPAAWSLLRPLN